MISATTVLGAVWASWLLAWLVASWRTAPTVQRQSASGKLAHALPIWIGAALLFMQPRRWSALVHPLFPHHAWIEWLGVAIVLLGLAYAGWARVHLGRFWSSTVTLKAGHTLIRTGPYAVTRHPIYTGLLTALVGTAMTRGTDAALLGLVLVTAGILAKVHQEEQLLLLHFGSSYETYQDEVPGLVPRIT